ncbi:MAG: DNA polymerase III epsilon subunit-like protein 3'-5' exonuclease [archaeon GW2011_AR20]|nr:MAG: DNA polymerase III epsilon subunit-like protein 3'-5' exonuclease [archaeon GW2011_AR20]MBS3160858.1 ribonuclease H-like domain-containing protein [Candidatus Woesearchaeota archaeon]
MEYLFLDIETVPLEINDEFIMRYLMDKKLTDAARSLNPHYSRIIVIGLKYNNEVRLLTGDEKEILTQFWDFMKTNNSVIVTHNGYKFDIPFIIIRSMINNLRVSKEINLNHWNMLKSNHLDTMIIFSQNVFTNPNLKVLAKLNNIEFIDEGITGKDVERLWKENNLEKIKEHCKNDIETLEKLFNSKCRGYIEKL